MPLTFLRHAAQKPRMGALKLAVGHPLAQGLTWAPLFLEGSGLNVWEPITGHQLTFGSSVSWDNAAPGGASMKFPGSTGQYATGSFGPKPSGGPWTYSAKYMVPSDVDHLFFDLGSLATDALLHTGPYFGNQGIVINLFSDDRELDFTAPSGKNLGVWTHVHVTQTADKVITVYLNGVSQATSTAAGMFVGTNGTFTLGARSQGSEDDFIGSMEHFMFWNRALNPAEIKMHVAEPYAMWQTRPIQVWISVAGTAPGVQYPTTRIRDQIRTLNSVRRGRVWHAWGGGVPIPLQPGGHIRVPARMPYARKRPNLLFIPQFAVPIPLFQPPIIRAPYRRPPYRRVGRLWNPSWPPTAPIPLLPGQSIRIPARLLHYRRVGRAWIPVPLTPVIPGNIFPNLRQPLRHPIWQRRGRLWNPSWFPTAPIPLLPGQTIRVPARLLYYRRVGRLWLPGAVLSSAVPPPVLRESLRQPPYRRVGRLWFPSQPTPVIPGNVFPNLRQSLRHPIWQRRGRIWNPSWPPTAPIPLLPGQSIRVPARLLHYRRVGRLWMPVQPTPQPPTYPVPSIRTSLRQPPYRRVGRLWTPAPFLSAPPGVGYPQNLRTSLRQPPYRRVGRLWVPIQPFIAPPPVSNPVLLIIGGRVAVPVGKGVWEWI